MSEQIDCRVRNEETDSLQCLIVRVKKWRGKLMQGVKTSCLLTHDQITKSN